jgi:hypothetical protein
MNYLYTIFFLLLLFSYQSDIEQRDNLIVWSEIASQSDLKSISVETQIELINPTEIFLYDTLLVVIDLQNKMGSILLFRKDTRGLTFLKAIGSEGTGPGEYFGLVKVEGYDRHLYAYDISMSSVTIISVDSVLQNREYIPQKRYSYERPKIHNFELIDSKNAVVGYYRENPRFKVLANMTDTSESFHNYPPLENKFKLPSAKFVGGVRGSLFQGTLDYDHKSQLLIFAYNNCSAFDIINMKNKSLLARVVGPDDNMPPEYVLTDDQRASLLKESKHGFNHVDITDKYIYCLYSGKKYELNFGDMMTGTAIIKFKHDGTPVAKYKLDPEISSFAVDEENGKIYGVNYYDNPLVVFDIP